MPAFQAKAIQAEPAEGGAPAPVEHIVLQVAAGKVMATCASGADAESLARILNRASMAPGLIDVLKEVAEAASRGKVDGGYRIPAATLAKVQVAIARTE